MKKSKIALILLILSFTLWIYQIINPSEQSSWDSYISPTIQFGLMIAFYFAIKYEK